MLSEKPVGIAYKVLVGYSVIVSDNTGSFSGPNIYYTYANTSFAIKGTFDENSNLIEGQKVMIENNSCGRFGMMEADFTKPYKQENVFYHYKPPTNSSFGDQPQVPDELAIEYLEVKHSDHHMDGLFAIKDIPLVNLIKTISLNYSNIFPVGDNYLTIWWIQTTQRNR